MLSFLELEKAAGVLRHRFLENRLERVVQRDDNTVVLSFYGQEEGTENSSKRHVLVSCAPKFGRVSEVTKSPKAKEPSPAFQSLLKARLVPSRLVDVALFGEDRQLAFHFESPEEHFVLLLCLMGNRSNLYFLSAERTVLAALRPLAQTRRTLSVGSPWEDPPAPAQKASEGAESRWQDVPDHDLLEAIESQYTDVESDGQAEGVVHEVRRGLRKERKLTRRRLERIRSELGEAEEATRLQRDGELLKASLGDVRPGSTELKVRDFETEEEVTIPLDPRKTPAQNLQATFKRYQKLVRRLAKAGAQVERAEDRDRQLAEFESRFEEIAADAAAVLEFTRDSEVQQILKKHVSRGRKAEVVAPPERLPAPLRDIPQRLVPRRYRSRDGLEIWVGRSDEGNDLLSTRLARGNDLFFHLDGAPGSHVVLRTEGRKDPPSESLLDACELAVHFSKFKNAGSADVHIVPIKQVKKPKGAKKGLVYVSGGRSLHLRREETRLERLMQSRIDG